MTVGRLLEEFLADFARLVALGERRASTLTSYRSWVKTWLVELGSMTVAEICSPRAPARIRSWAMDVARRAATKKRAHDGTATASRCLVVLDLAPVDLPGGASPGWRRRASSFTRDGRGDLLAAGALKRAEFEGLIPRGAPRRGSFAASPPAPVSGTSTTARWGSFSRRSVASRRSASPDPGDVADRLVAADRRVRHSLATCALRAGAPLEHVATVLGHTSTAITRRVYGRPLANPGARAVVDDFARRVRA